MPVLSGFEMCVKLHQNTATAPIPVLMLTALGHKIEPSEIAQTKIVSLIPKPFSASELMKKIDEYAVATTELDQHDLDRGAVVA